MDFDTQVKVAVYRHIADATTAPTVADVASAVNAADDDVRAAFGRLFAKRVLVLEADGASIRMAPPFSAVPTQHRVEVGRREYFANCAWDALGIPAALHASATVRSRCEQTSEPLELTVSASGPEPSTWLFHCAVPASKWWQDIVYT